MDQQFAEGLSSGRRILEQAGDNDRLEIFSSAARETARYIAKGLDEKLAEQPGQLFVDDRTTFPLFIAGCPRPGMVKFDDDSLARFEAAIGADQIDVVILDPFISFHTVPENDNGGVDAVIKRLAAIAVQADCSIEISHHVRKPFTGQREITVDDARGGSAIINAVRSGRVINRMSAGEAEQAKVDPDQKNFYVRLDLGKRNMAPPGSAAD